MIKKEGLCWRNIEKDKLSKIKPRIEQMRGFLCVDLLLRL